METNDYVESLFDNWENKKNETRKKLPEIYKTANEDVKAIIEMLVDAEYVNAIRMNNIRGDRISTDEYHKKNYEIMKMIGMVR